MIRWQDVYGASQNNILYWTAYILLRYSIFLVFCTSKIYSTGILHLLHPHIFFKVYIYIFFVKVEVCNIITVVTNLLFVSCISGLMIVILL
jgi:hypothetical protein